VQKEEWGMESDAEFHNFEINLLDEHVKLDVK